MHSQEADMIHLLIKLTADHLINSHKCDLVHMVKVYWLSAVKSGQTRDEIFATPAVCSLQLDTPDLNSIQTNRCHTTEK